MNPLGLFPNRQLRLLSIVLSVVGFVYLLANIFVLGGDAFIYSLNSLLVSPLALCTSLLAALLWRQMKVGRQNRLLWAGLLAGWICWSIAESLWAIYSLRGEDPYPSWADFFFLIAYLPMYSGFFSRLRNLPKKLLPTERMWILLISIFVVAVTFFFILIPILQEYDPQRFLESLLGLAYPLGDLILLILTLQMIFTYGSGDYGLGWRLILLGFVTVTISDLFYSYADWNGLYYPNGVANAISTLAVDVLYNASYVLWAVGVYALSVVLRQHQAFKIDLAPRLVANAHVFFFTRSNGTVISASNNYERVFSQNNPAGRMLGRALGISEQAENAIQSRLATERRLTDFPIQIRNQAGELQDGWLCGMPVINQPSNHSGAVLVLRTFLEDGDRELSEYQRSILPFVLEGSNSQENQEIRKFLFLYYLAYLKSLFNLVLREGGAPMSQSLLDELQALAQKQGWRFQFNAQQIIDDTGVTLETLREALPIFLNAAEQFAAQLTDPLTVESELQNIHAQFDRQVHECVAQFQGSTPAVVGKPPISQTGQGRPGFVLP